MSALVKPEVVAGWRAFNAPLEGVVPWMYLDVRGLVTIGIGCLIDPVGLALRLPFLRSADGTPATPGQIDAEWRRVKAMAAAMPAARYRGPLFLDDAAVDALLGERLASTARELVRHYPELPEWPAAAQKAALSIAWACGAGYPPRWPKFSAAVRRRDWLAAAEECAISTKGNAGVAARNRANRALLLQAAVEDSAS